MIKPVRSQALAAVELPVRLGVPAASTHKGKKIPPSSRSRACQRPNPRRGVNNRIEKLFCISIYINRLQSAAICRLFPCPLHNDIRSISIHRSFHGSCMSNWLISFPELNSFVERYLQLSRIDRIIWRELSSQLSETGALTPRVRGGGATGNQTVAYCDSQGRRHGVNASVLKPRFTQPVLGSDRLGLWTSSTRSARNLKSMNS